MNEKNEKKRENSKEKNYIDGENSCRKLGPQKFSCPHGSTNILLDKINIGSGNDQIYETSQGPQVNLGLGNYMSYKFDDKMYRLKKHNETVKILITKDELALKGYNYARQEILKKSKDDDIYLMILKYADIVLERIIELSKFPFYKKTFIRKTIQLKIIDLFGGKDYITKEDKFFALVKKYREYKALTYEIRCKRQFPDAQYQNRGYYGYTRSTEDIRLINHTIEAIEQNVDYLKGYRANPPTKLNKVIIIALKDMGYIIEDLHFSLQSSNMKEQIKLLKKITQRLKTDYFDVIVLEFHKKLETAVKREIQLIAEHNYISIGLNECGGGQGGLPYIFLLLYDIAGMIALGVTQKKILKILNKLYSKDFMNFKIGENTLRRRIIEECLNWVNAQKIFLKPVVEVLVLIGFSDKKIYDTLSSPHSKEGWIYRWWKKGDKLDFEFWIDSRELDISKESERYFNPEVKLCGIPISKWEEWAIKEIPNSEIVEISGLSFNTIVSVYKHNFGGRNKILLNYRRDKTIKMRKKGMSLKNIYISIFKKNYYPSNFRRDFRKWFNGMTPEQIEEKWTPEKG
ncbi:hypothetical protein LCGC14_1404290 [marine sediment metagenome]|uniref:Uncharacterized protein n=1 Tax=marine sediment metagenome TaxID=412755 RepID=A0A0F9KH40_9ZZZZ